MTVGSEVQKEKKFRLYLDESAAAAETMYVEKIALVKRGREEK